MIFVSLENAILKWYQLIKNLKLYSLEQIEQNFYKQERKFKIYQNEHNRIKQPYNHNIKQIFKISYFV